MHASPKVAPERTSRIGLAVLLAIGVALLAAAALGTYEASLAKARAVRDVVPEGPPNALQYLPGSSGQIGALPEPLMAARRAVLRAGFDGQDAPIDAYDRLRAIPGHDEEARSLLAQFWERKAMLADDPLRRVLYAVQARVVDDDGDRRRSAESAMAALGPLRRARHVAEGTVLSSDARTLVLRGSGWLHVMDLESGGSFDLAEKDTGATLVDGRWIVTWGDDTARLWDLDSAPVAPVATFTLSAGEVPLAFAGGCVLTSDGRVWRAGDAAGPVRAARGRWLAGSINPTCDRVVLRGPGIASYRRRGKAWTAESARLPVKGPSPGPSNRSGQGQVEACATRAPRCVLDGVEGVRSVWDFGASPPRLLFEGVDCEAKLFSPNGTWLMCRESQDGVTFYDEDATGDWRRTDVMLPGVSGSFLEDDGTVCGSLPSKDIAALDRADVLFLAAHECWAPPAAERVWGSIRMLPAGNGAVFTYPPAGRGARGSPAYSEFFGFDSRGESLAAASNAWFGERTDQRLLEHDATNSAEEKSYELAGAPFDPALALGDRSQVSSVQIDDALFVQSPEPSLVVEIGYVRHSASSVTIPLRAVARWDLRARRFCGPPLTGSITGIAPTGDVLVVDGRVYRIGACSSERGFEPTDVSGVSAVGPGAAHWVARDGDSLLLEGPEQEPSVVLRGEKASDAQVAFSPNGTRFLVRTAGSLCDWTIRDDGGTDLDGCRWSTGGWPSDAAWAAVDKSGDTAVVFDRTAEGAALREFFGNRERDAPVERGGDLACDALPRSDEPPLAVLQQWEERLGHRFKEQATQLQEARSMSSSEIVPAEAPVR